MNTYIEEIFIFPNTESILARLSEIKNIVWDRYHVTAIITTDTYEDITIKCNGEVHNIFHIEQDEIAITFYGLLLQNFEKGVKLLLPPNYKSFSKYNHPLWGRVRKVENPGGDF